MEHKIFLGKYRVAPDEVALAAADPATMAVATTEQVAPGRIYRGEEIDSGRTVTVEVIPSGAFKPSVRAKLEEEATAAKQINHINIPALYDFGVEDDHLIYVTEYFDGTSAEEWVNQHGSMPTGAVLRIALQVMGAMGAASFHKIAHHAINPANLILVPGQTAEGDWPLVKVLHFIGVAPTFVGGDMSVAAFDKSTHYASPEQLQGGAVDFRSEIYSLGATMWFLLTGAPPLMAPKGPLAMQPTTIGLAVDKLKGMPKRVRRLLAQMLSVDPAARPQDPLAVYRQIQDCVVQVERRESMARKLGVPFLSGAKIASFPSRRIFPTRRLALAAVIIAFATLASILVASYWRHERVRQAAEPIGVPIGVSETTASAPPAIANAPTVAPAPPQPPQQTAAPNTADENQPPPPAPEKAPVVAANNQQQEPAVAPAPSEAPKVVAKKQEPAETVAPAPAEPPKVAATNEKTAPTVAAPPSEAPKIVANEPQAAEEKSNAPEPPKIAANKTKVVEKRSNPPEPPKIAANEPQVVEEKSSAPESKQLTRSEIREEKTERAPEVAAVRPISPEVRRAEPAPPAEGPEEVAPANAPEKKVAPTTKVVKERTKKPKRESDEESIPRAERVDDEQVVPSEAPQVQQLPRGRTRAKFIGVTADGNWMFSLPNKKIVIVPPPPGG
jgi:serine/threonine protein kinase